MLMGLVSVFALCGLLVGLVGLAAVLVSPLIPIMAWLDRRAEAREERETAERRRRYRVTRRAVADFRTAADVRASVRRAIDGAR